MGGSHSERQEMQWFKVCHCSSFSAKPPDLIIFLIWQPKDVIYCHSVTSKGFLVKPKLVMSVSRSPSGPQRDESRRSRRPVNALQTGFAFSNNLDPSLFSIHLLRQPSRTRMSRDPNRQTPSWRTKAQSRWNKFRWFALGYSWRRMSDGSCWLNGLCFEAFSRRILIRPPTFARNEFHQNTVLRIIWCVATRWKKNHIMLKINT